MYLCQRRQVGRSLTDTCAVTWYWSGTLADTCDVTPMPLLSLSLHNDDFFHNNNNPFLYLTSWLGHDLVP